MNIGTCVVGMEDVVARKTDGKKVCEGRVSFLKLKNFRTIDTIYELFERFSFKNIEDIIGKIKKFKLKKKITVSCKRTGKHNFKSVDVEKAASTILRELGFDLSFKNYEDVFYIDIVNNTCFLGKLIKKDLCKRDYRVKLCSGTMNACLAASVLQLVGVKKGDVFLDPVCQDGIINLEASFLTNKNYGYGRDVYSARINAKIGKRKIKFENADLSDLSKFFKKDSVDIVVSYLPSVSKKRPYLGGFYKRFFDQVHGVLKGKLCIICLKDKVFSFAKGFYLVEERKVFVQNTWFFVSIFNKDQ